MGGVTAAQLLLLPVRLHGIQLGRPVDLILDPERRRALGFEVRCGDDERRFLPLAATSVREHELAIASPLVLLEEAQLAFYTERGSTFVGLRGSDVVRGRHHAGVLEDLVLADDDSIAAVVVSTASGTERIPADKAVIAPRRVRAAS